MTRVLGLLMAVFLGSYVLFFLTLTNNESLRDTTAPNNAQLPKETIISQPKEKGASSAQVIGDKDEVPRVLAEPKESKDLTGNTRPIPEPSSVQDDVKHHMIFSTGCNTFQDWQSYMFFYHAHKVKQPGYVTRIASGCKEEEKKQLQQIHETQIATMSDKFLIHFTPDFMGIKPGFRYKFFNKPFGVHHWMEHALGYPKDTSEDDTVIILLDPDQMLLRPLTYDFRNATVIWKGTKDKAPPKVVVQHGSPFGQLYGFGAQWMTKVNVSYIVQNEPTPIDNISMPQARDYYSLGPPYMATAKDFYQIVLKWTEFMLRVHEVYPHLLAEMFAYCLAAAHLGLPHQTAVSFMVSDTSGGGREGWALVDPLGPEKACNKPPREGLPFVLHYCQRYMLGKWFIGKYRLRKDFMSCEAPLLMEPPSDIGVKYDYYYSPGSPKEKVPYKRKPHITRNAFTICELISALNEAAEYYKRHNCDAKANFDKTYIFHDSIE